jgi:hypothetical protein
MDLGTRRDKRAGSRIGAGEAQDLMARTDEFLHDGRSNEACGTGNENAHGKFSLIACRDHFRSLLVAS